MDDPFIAQFMACESGNTSDEAFHSDLVWPGGVELVDRIGPCIMHGHAFGGFFGWGVADRRPSLVKGIVCMEINGNPFERQLRWGLTASPMTYDPPVTDPRQFTLVDHTPPPDSPRPIASPYKLQAEPARKWKNLQGIPIGVADERVRRRRIAGRERRVPEAGGMLSRDAAPARLGDLARPRRARGRVCRGRGNWRHDHRRRPDAQAAPAGGRVVAVEPAHPPGPSRKRPRSPQDPGNRRRLRARGARPRRDRRGDRGDDEDALALTSRARRPGPRDYWPGSQPGPRSTPHSSWPPARRWPASGSS